MGATRAKAGKKGGSSRNRVSSNEEEEEIELEEMGAPPIWHKNKDLSTIESKKWQVHWFKEKLTKNDPYLRERTLYSERFEQYGLYEPFRKWGWMAVMQPIQHHLIKDTEKDAANKRGKVYEEAICEWLSTLEKVEVSEGNTKFELVGTVKGRKATLSLDTFHEMAGGEDYYDTGAVNGVDYEYPSDLLSRAPAQMYKDLFQLPENKTWENYTELKRKDMRPWAQVWLRFITYNILPRASDPAGVVHREIQLLHALYTGSPVYSLRYVMMLYIWNCRESKERGTMPYTRFLSAFLKHARVLKKDHIEKIVEVAPMDDRLVGWHLDFTHEWGEFCIEHTETLLRDVFVPGEVDMDVDEEEAEYEESDSDYAEDDEDDQEAERQAIQPSSNVDWGQLHSQLQSWMRSTEAWQTGIERRLDSIDRRLAGLEDRRPPGDSGEDTSLPPQ